MHPDLGERWLGGMGRIQRDADGSARSIVGINFDISRRKRAELALRESEELLTRFVRSSPIYCFIKIVTPEDSRVLIASDNFGDMIGMPGSDMVGKSMTELYPGESGKKITAEDWMCVQSDAP